MQDLSLPPRFNATFTLAADQNAQYLQAVGGGHPVHTSREAALRAGFTDVPLAGIHVIGSAMATFTRQFAANPMQLLHVDVRFLKPAYPGDQLVLLLERCETDHVPRAPFHAARYRGGCTNGDGKNVVSLDFTIRVALA
jgi:acyl dehydratase